MRPLNKQTAPKAERTERIIQFGEGNFLRAFVDWIIFNMNEKANFDSSVVVVQPIEKGMVDMLNGQDCLYHVNLQGLDKGRGVREGCLKSRKRPISLMERESQPGRGPGPVLCN